MRRRRAPRRLGFESLEHRRLLAVDLSPREQLMLELINRARAHPAAEAARLGIDLNQGLAPGTISPDPKAPLAAIEELQDASRGHSQDMIDRDFFDHVSPDGEGVATRLREAGYPVTPGFSAYGENIAWEPSQTIQDVYDAFDGLFLSPGHRENMLHPDWRDVGVGVRLGEFRDLDGSSYAATLVTQNFGDIVGSALVGVVYDDSVVNNDFYEVGEGLAGVTVTAINADDNGLYTVILQPNRVRDTSGHAAPSQVLGRFAVYLDQPSVQLSQANLGAGDAMSYASLAYNARDEEFLALWIERRSVSESNLYGRRIDAGTGQPLDEPVRITPPRRKLLDLARNRVSRGL